MKEKLTCYVARDVLKAARLAAADADVTLSGLVERALVDALAKRSRIAAEVLNRGAAGALDVARKMRKTGDALGAIAAALNREGYRTQRGKPWSVVAVSRLLKAD